MKSTELNFKDQPIFVGLDIARKSWKVCILTKEFEHKTFTQPPQTPVLVRYLNRYFPGADYHCVYEAGFSGFWAHDELEEYGVDCMVVNPGDVPSTNKEQVNKTDRVDARKLARGLRSGELRPIYVPTKQQLEDRALVRTRHFFVNKQTRCRNQIKALLYFHGIRVPENFDRRNWSGGYIKWLEGLTTQYPSGTFALKALLEELASLRKVLIELNKKIKDLSREPLYEKRFDCLKTIPGIGPLTAMILLTELVDINRFRSLDELACYFGLVPGEHSTGDRKVITGISKRRNTFLRTLIIESSWTAVRKDPALIQAFDHLCKRMSHNKAIIRIARKLINRIRFVLMNEKPYMNCVLTTKKA